MIVAIPALTPVTMPDPVPTLAVPGAELDHAPNKVASLRFVVRPTHTFKVPVIDAGSGLTVYTATLPVESGKVQPVATIVILVRVTVVKPAVVIGTVVKVPEPETTDTVVLLDAVFAPVIL